MILLLVLKQESPVLCTFVVCGSGRRVAVSGINLEACMQSVPFPGRTFSCGHWHLKNKARSTHMVLGVPLLKHKACMQWLRLRESDGNHWLGCGDCKYQSEAGFYTTVLLQSSLTCRMLQCVVFVEKTLLLNLSSYIHLSNLSHSETPASFTASQLYAWVAVV